MEQAPVGKASIGMDGNVAAALGYPIGLIALVLLLTEKENKFVRYHAIQALLWIALFVVLYLLVFVLGFFSMFIGIFGSAASNISAFGILGSLVFFAAMLVAVGVILSFMAGMIYSAIAAYQGRKHSLPLVGRLAARWA